MTTDVVDVKAALTTNLTELHLLDGEADLMKKQLVWRSAKR